MKIGVFGSGTVGKTIAAKLAEIGQDVMVGSRSPEKLQDWVKEHPSVKVGSYSACAAHGEIIINATRAEGTFAALESAGEANLNGKILIDISNPLDFSKGMPPTLSVSNTDSFGEQIQRAFPQVKVVKTLNTLTASLMVDPRSLADGDHTLFLNGDDAAAKDEVAHLLTEWFGWRDFIDLGDITTARGTEAILLLWIRLFMKFGNPHFQLKVVR